MVAGRVSIRIATGKGTHTDVQQRWIAVRIRCGVRGQVVVVGTAPLLRVGFSTNHLPQLTLYGNPGSSYLIEWKTNLLQSPWMPGWTVIMTNLSETFSRVGTNSPTEFYRGQKLD